MRLETGAEAPDFEVSTHDGSIVRLADYRGKRLWLGFFRYASCPLCNIRVHDMIVRAEALRAAGLEIAAVFQSPPESIAQYVGKQAPPFPLLSDPGEELYRRYGLETSLAGFLAPSNGARLVKALASGFMPGKAEGSMTRVPADFLIDGEGRIVDAFYGKAISDHIPFEQVENFVADP